MEKGKGKASYLFDLDKHKSDAGFDKKAMLVIDGEYYGSPTRFINHSCDPNCGVYTVSYNKNDPYRYNLAFFAQEDILKGTELCFDYLEEGDREDDEDIEDEEDEPTSSQHVVEKLPCYCGSKNCRGYLWG